MRAHADVVVSSSTISIVLRVLSEPAGEGRLVGQAEVVETGEIVPLAAHDELLRLVRRLSGVLD